MAESTSLPIPRTTSPLYGAQAGELAGQLATLSTEELAKILRVNHRIAATNRLRYSRFHDNAVRALPALAAYTGTLLLVTHDRYLMQTLDCPIMYLENGSAS